MDDQFDYSRVYNIFNKIKKCNDKIKITQNLEVASATLIGTGVGTILVSELSGIWLGGIMAFSGFYLNRKSYEIFNIFNEECGFKNLRDLYDDLNKYCSKLNK